MAFLFSSSDSESAARTTSSLDRSGRHYQSFSSSASSSHRAPKRSPGRDEIFDSPPTSATSRSSVVAPRLMESSRSREPKASESSNMSPTLGTSMTPSSAPYQSKSSVSGMLRKEPSHRKDPSPEGSKRTQHAVSMSDMRVRSTRASAHHPMPNEFGQLSVKQASPSSVPISQLSANASRSGSQSDSGLKVRRPHEYSSASSKHNLHLSPVDFRQPSPTSPRMAASGSASDGGGSSDRASSPLIASRHDIKRLLSKPAAPSRASTISITSDSDSPVTNFAWSPSSMYGSGSPRRGRIDELAEFPSTSRRTKTGKMRAVSTTAELGVATLGVDDKSTRSRPGSSRGSSMHRDAPGSSSSRDKDRDKDRETRNVLKKRSTGDGLRPGSAFVSPMDTTPESLRPGSGRHASLAKTHADLAFERSPRSTTSLSARDPRGSGAATNPRQPSPTPKLTPAGAIAQAYKAQNDRREELAAQARGDEERPRKPPSSGVGDLKQWQLPSSLPFEAYLNEHKEEQAKLAQSRPSPADMNEARGPYYTVFGSTTGRLVAVGSAEDDRLTFTGAGVGEVDRGRSTTPTTRASVSAQPPPSVRQSLSRKMSGRFRRAKAESQATNTPATIVELARGGRPSLQERRSASLPKERRKSLRLSMDNCDELGTPSHTSRSTPSSSKRPDSKKSSTPSASDETYPTPAGIRGKLHKAKEREKGKEKEKEKEQEDEVSPGGKLWKLVKRISTGGLRDRYQSGGSLPPPPPVPAIPKALLSVPSSRATFEVRTPTESPGEPGSGVNRFMQSRTSLSGVRPSTAPGRENPEKPTSRRPSTGLPKGHRPSTATRSSSPHSSTDMASTQFFHRSHSNHSSSSSYGGELPPIPKTSLGKWILPPSELYRLESGNAETSSASSSQRPAAQSPPPLQTTPTLPSLPHPPRRPSLPAQNDSPPPSSRSSLDIPLFSTSEPVNRFSQRKPSVSRTHEKRPSLKIISSSMPKSDFGLVSTTSLVPPPRPTRSSRRPSATNSSPLSSDASHSPMTPPSMLSIDTSDALSFTKSNDSADGHSNASTARQKESSPVAQLTFRELDQSPRTAWTEQEKHQKWEDLLERSARAGGTLHLGEGGLLSDNMRFSNYSESM